MVTTTHTCRKAKKLQPQTSDQYRRSLGASQRNQISPEQTATTKKITGVDVKYQFLTDEPLSCRSLARQVRPYKRRQKPSP